MKITKITPAQIARFSDWTKQWIEIGLSTEPADFDKATEAALRGYALANLKRPTVILRMSSPYGAVMGGALAWMILKEAFGREVRSQVGSQFNNNSYHVSLYASWAAYVSFFRDVMDWRDPILDRFEIDEALIKSCGWVWWHENVLAISDRPEFIRRDEQNRLHCTNGPAIKYRDGWSLYSWHGTSIPELWILDRAKLTAQVALKETNIELRRAACEILGWVNILRDLKAKTIDRDNDPEIGELIEVELPGLAAPAKFLRVRCGTGREFAIGIPSDINKALDAQAWIIGLEPKDFNRPEIRS